jgi:hypothetical protein
MDLECVCVFCCFAGAAMVVVVSVIRSFTNGMECRSQNGTVIHGTEKVRQLCGLADSLVKGFGLCWYRV